MICPKCFTENDNDALFCKKCGTNLNTGKPNKNSKNKIFDILLFISITYWFVMDFLNVIIRVLVNNWYDSPFKYFQMGTNLIYAAIPIFIALSIKSKGLKIPAIIFAALISSYILYTNIEWMITEYNREISFAF
ncbi:MAG: zinc ribbon domain-containing protein [Bacteroidia bacterium]|nr:zinc ribbon domain-containing protein [Bacteroidia bacterium]